MKKEIWKDVVGFKGSYQVSDKGRLRSVTRIVGIKNKRLMNGRVLKPSKRSNGYVYAVLSRMKVKKMCSMHRLVAEAFIENKESKPCVNHIDGSRCNNNVSNLEWVTFKENNRHAVNTGLIKVGEMAPASKLKEESVLSIRRIYKESKITKKDLGKKFNVDEKTIRDILSYRTWKHLIY